MRHCGLYGKDETAVQQSAMAIHTQQLISMISLGPKLGFKTLSTCISEARDQLQSHGSSQHAFSFASWTLVWTQKQWYVTRTGRHCLFGHLQCTTSGTVKPSMRASDCGTAAS